VSHYVEFKPQNVYQLNMHFTWTMMIIGALYNAHVSEV